MTLYRNWPGSRPYLYENHRTGLVFAGLSPYQTSWFHLNPINLAPYEMSCSKVLLLANSAGGPLSLHHQVLPTPCRSFSITWSMVKLAAL